MAAASRNHEFVLAYNAVTKNMELFGNNGTQVASLNLTGIWRPVAAETYRGPAFVAQNLSQENEAFLVLHQNGYMIPWYHHASNLYVPGYSLWISPPPAVEGVTRSFVDVDQAVDGTIYLLTSEVENNHTSNRIWKRTPAGVWSSNGDAFDGGEIYKATAISLDKQANRLAVATHPLSSHIVVDVYDKNLAAIESWSRPNSHITKDIEYFMGHFILGIDVCGPQTCRDHIHLIEMRNPSWQITESRTVSRVESLGLDLPPLPLNYRGNTRTALWHTGVDVPAGQDSFTLLHRYQLQPGVAN